MDLSLTDTQRNGSEEARGGTARRRDSLWGVRGEKSIVSLLGFFYPKRYSIIVRRGNGGTAYNKGTTTAHACTRTRNVDLLYTVKATQTAGETVASGEAHTHKKNAKLLSRYCKNKTNEKKVK